MRVAVTGGAGNIAYNLLFRIASGEMLGAHQPIDLHILEIPEAESILKGVEMELYDCAFAPLKNVRIGSDPKTLFKDVDIAILVGAKPRSKGMERGDLLKENGKIFIEQGRALNEVASRSVQVFVVGNPCNTNCWTAMKCAPDLSPSQFHAMTRLDENRGKYQLAQKAEVEVTDIERFAIWGNHSATQVPDILNATIRKRPLMEVISDHDWLKTTFFKNLQQRGAQIIEARGKSSAASAASSAIDGIQALMRPTPSESWYSDCVYSKGNPYGIDEDLIFSFPCKSSGEGKWEFVQDLSMDHFMKEKLKLTEKELLEEKEIMEQMLKEKA